MPEFSFSMIENDETKIMIPKNKRKIEKQIRNIQEVIKKPNVEN